MFNFCLTISHFVVACRMQSWFTDIRFYIKNNFSQVVVQSKVSCYCLPFADIAHDVCFIFRKYIYIYFHFTCVFNAHKKNQQTQANLERVRNKQFEAFPYDFLHAPIVVTIKWNNNCICIVQVNLLPCFFLFLPSIFNNGLSIDLLQIFFCKNPICLLILSWFF